VSVNSGYTYDMALQRKVAQLLCPSCGRPLNAMRLQTCMICRSLFCLQCAVTGYGRDFCSKNCRAMFFFGDGDEESAEDE